VQKPASSSRRTLLSIFLYLALWTASVALLYQREHADISEPLLIFLILGVVFPALAWLATRWSTPIPSEVKRPPTECLFLACYFLLIVVYLTWGIRPQAADAPQWPHLLVSTLEKLLIFVLLPYLALTLFWRYHPRELFTFSFSKHRWIALSMSLLLIAFQCVFGNGLQQIHRSGLSTRSLIIGTPLAFLFLMLEVGLVEEFFFRVLLQSRITALLRSEVAGIVFSSLLFGLAHAPGLYLRASKTNETLGPEHSLLASIAYCIAYTSVAGIFLGVLWSRTKNLLVVVTVHAATDLLPNLVSLIRTF
jgi:membrane protease YdiL (CAAX protease family)